MPKKKHLRGASDKEQRQYEHIKESAQKSGRYGSRAKEVAARTVMKKRAQKKKGKKSGGKKTGSRTKASSGKSSTKKGRGRAKSRSTR
jgi:hypothetical protein